MVVDELTLLIVIPLGISIINIFLPSILRKILTFLGLCYLLFISYNLFKVPAGDIYIFNQVIFSLDKLSFFTIAFIQILSFIILIFSLKGVVKSIEKQFFVLYPMTVAFCNGAVLSVHALSLLIFWGLTGITLYLFGVLGQTKDAPKTAKKTFIIVGGSDAFMILGFVLIWFLQPATGWSLWNVKLELSSQLAYIAFFCILIASFAKAGGFPFHTWVPDFSKDAPVESAALLPASLDKLLGIYLFTRIVISLFVLNFGIHLMLITLGALTIIIAVMMAMIQHNGRKLLGYHAVSQAGYMIMGVGCGSWMCANGDIKGGSIVALAGGLFHLVNNAIYKANLFLTLGSVEKKTGTNDLDNLGGLGRNMPITFTMALISALSISGIPPFNGFFSKWLIYQGVLDLAKDMSPGYQIWLLICLILAVFGSALTLASFLKFLHSIFLGKRPKTLDNIKETSANHWIATGLLAALCIVFGLFAMQVPIKHFIMPIVIEQGWAVPTLLGSYNPILVILLFGLAFLVGLIIYLITKNVRYDEIYLGGMEPLEKFRVAGTEFYNEIRNMVPLRSIYNSAEKKYFDVYDLGSKGSFSLARLFSSIHRGQLQLYSLWILVGVLIILWVVK